MKSLLLFFPLSMSLFAQETVRGAEASDELLGTVLLADGSWLRGHLEGGVGEDKVSWKLKAVEAPLTLPLAAVVEMSLPGMTAPERFGDYQARVRLTNGDLVPGRLVGLTDTTLQVKTWYGGILNLRRSMISDIEILSVQELIDADPIDIDAWEKVDDNEAWKLDHGALVSTKGGAISRKFELPSKCRVSFGLSWDGTLRFRTLFYADEGSFAQPFNCYDIVYQRRFIYLRKRWLSRESSGSRIIGQINVSALADEQEARVDLYFDRDRGTIGLYVNGSQAVVWTDGEADVGAFGNYITLVAEDLYPTRVSRLDVFKWDGNLPADVVPPDEIPDWDGKKDVLQLQDRTFVSGELREIRGDVFQIDSSGQQVETPVAKIRALHLGQGNYEEPKRRKGDIRAWTPDGGRITFRLDAYGPEILKGHSSTFGDAEFQRAAFSRLEFNLYDEALKELRDQRE